MNSCSRYRSAVCLVCTCLIVFCSHRTLLAGDGPLLDELLGIDAEIEEAFETDRDSFTPATNIVPKSKIMVESAISFIDNRDVPESYSFPELLIRYGATDWLELRFLTNYDIGGEASEVSGVASSGERELEAEGEGGIFESAKVSYGLKAALTSQSDWIPESSLIIAGVTPTSGAETASSLVTTYAFGWKFENDIVWDSSIRYGITGDGDSTWQWAPSSVVKMPVGEAGSLHLEYFGIFSESPEGDTDKQYLSPGYHIEVWEDVEVGLRVGWGLNDESAKFFSNFGIGILY